MRTRNMTIIHVVHVSGHVPTCPFHSRPSHFNCQVCCDKKHPTRISLPDLFNQALSGGIMFVQPIAERDIKTA